MTTLWVVCGGSGYYAESIWDSYGLAYLEACKIEGAEKVDEDPDRFVQPWELNIPKQHFKKFMEEGE